MNTNTVRETQQLVVFTEQQKDLVAEVRIAQLVKIMNDLEEGNRLLSKELERVKILQIDFSYEKDITEKQAEVYALEKELEASRIEVSTHQKAKVARVAGLELQYNNMNAANALARASIAQHAHIANETARYKAMTAELCKKHNTNVLPVYHH